MSTHYTPEMRKEFYDKIYQEMKAKGLNDRDADIVTIARMYPRSAHSMSNKYGIPVEEVKAIVLKNL